MSSAAARTFKLFSTLEPFSSFAIPLPIGIANCCWEWGNLQTLAEVIKQEIPKNKEVYYYFTSKGGERDIHREPCTDICTQLTIPIQPKQKFKDYLINLKQHKFSICPSGNGLDTYRLWESLYLRTIPICIKTPFIDFFSKYFPMIVLEKWEDLKLINLEERKIVVVVKEKISLTKNSLIKNKKICLLKLKTHNYLMNHYKHLMS